MKKKKRLVNINNKGKDVISVGWRMIKFFIEITSHAILAQFHSMKFFLNTNLCLKVTKRSHHKVSHHCQHLREYLIEIFMQIFDER